jgi:phospholipid/cholesterol/gamma-HCH transport system permease protein
VPLVSLESIIKSFLFLFFKKEILPYFVMTSRLTQATENGATVLRFEGALDLASVADLWDTTLRAARLPKGAKLVIDLAAVPSCDTAGATLLAVAEQAAGGAEIRNANPEISSLLTRVRAARAVQAAPKETRQGNFLQDRLRDAADWVAFVGEVLVAIGRAPGRRRMFLVRDLLAYADNAGVQAIPLVALLGFLMGLILAFQSSIPLRQFGAQIFVVNLVVISLLRELGPLLAAVIPAGRTGSAFAAELGTMVVNDEVAAITTMGIDPVTMLVLPRLAATMLVMPGLSLLLEMAGLVGMTLVMGLLGYPPVAVYHQAIEAAKMRDLIGGLVKAMVFGAAIAVIGCRTGLGAGLGPRAVGQAATAAVVGGIFGTIMLDGIFTILFYRLHL